jgi:cytochrome P450
VSRLDDHEFFEDILRGASRFQSSARAYYVDAHTRTALHRHRDGFWIATSYELAESVLRDFRFTFGGRPVARSGAMRRVAAGWLELLDGDEHRASRKSAAQAIVGSAGDDVLHVVICRRLDRLTDANPAVEVDLVSAFLRPLWFDLVQTWLGLPLRPFVPLLEDVRSVAAALRHPENDDAAENAADRLLSTLHDVAAAARAGNGRGALLASTIDGDDEAASVRALNLYADAAPAVAAIGICIAAVLADDSLRAEITGQPGSFGGVVHELLRFDPVQVVLPRVATEPLDLAGQRIAAGDRLVVVVGAVNHDPSRFADPTAFRRDRTAGPLTFGSGPHACLGRATTLDIVTSALGGFFARFPKARLGAPAVWLAEPAMRCHEALHVRLSD